MRPVTAGKLLMSHCSYCWQAHTGICSGQTHYHLIVEIFPSASYISVSPQTRWGKKLREVENIHVCDSCHCMFLKRHILVSPSWTWISSSHSGLWLELVTIQSNRRPAFPISRLQTIQSGPRYEPQDLCINIDTTSLGVVCERELIVTTWDSCWWTRCSKGKPDRAEGELMLHSFQFSAAMLEAESRNWDSLCNHDFAVRLWCKNTLI